MKKLILIMAVCLTAFFMGSLKAQTITNYAFSATSGTFTALTGATSAGGATGGLDDGYYGAVPIGFTFYYMGQPYNNIYPTTNGWASFTNNTAATAGNNLATGGTRPVLSPLWEDLEVNAATGTVSYLTTGTPGNRIFTLEWLNVEWSYSAAAPGISFQIVLHESTGVIDFKYRQEAAAIVAPAIGTNGATIGISATATGAGNYLSLNNSSASPTVSSTTETTTITTKPATGQVYTFTPPLPSAAPTSLTFTAVGAYGMTVNWVDNSTNEYAFAVYRSTDAVNYSFAGNVASSTTAATGGPYSLVQTGLAPGVIYYYRVFAVTEGAYSSPALSGNQSTLAGSICGTRTVGPTGTYTSLTAAFADLAANAVSCPVILELQAAYVSTVETFPIVVPIMGTTATNTVTVRPETGATNLSITSSAAQTINFSAASGSSYVSFDGRPGGIGTSKELTIENTSGTGVAVRFINDAHHNTLTYVKLRGQNTSTTSGVVVLGDGATSAGNSNNTISNAEVFRTSGGQPANLIYSVNSIASSFNSNNTITNSLLYDNFQAGVVNVSVLLGTGNNAWSITNNSIYQTTTQTYTTGNIHNGIQVNNAGNNFTITGNFIGGSAANCGGSPWTVAGTVANRFVAINFSAGTTIASNIHNNTIQNFSHATSSGSGTVWVGIALTAGNVNVGTVGTPNFIGNTTSTGSITMTPTTTGGGVVLINSSSSGIINIIGNQMGAITANGSLTVSTSITGIQTSAGTTTISNNMIGSSTVLSSLVNSASTNGTSGNITGIISSSSGTTTINANVLGSFTNQYIGTGTGQTRGIVTSAGINTITGNTIGGIGGVMVQTGTGGSASVIGIHQTSTTAPQIITGNIISGIGNVGISGNIMVTGIEISGPTSGTNLVSQNRITGPGAPNNTGSPIINGIRIDGGIATYANNMIVLGVDPSGAAFTRSQEYNGIYKNTTSNNNFYFNSVSVTGTGVGTGTMNTYAFRRGSTGTDIVRNNIFSNTRSNGASTGVHYSMNLNATTTITSNNNDLFGNGTGYVLGIVGATPYNTLAAWQTGTTQDANSVSTIPPFVSAVDLHINGADPNSAFLDATAFNGSGITIDIDGAPRAATPDIGADEFVGPTCSSANGGTITPATRSICPGQTVIMTSTGATVGSGITYQWMISNTPGGPYSNVVGGSGATTTSYTSGPLTPGTYYYVLQTTCSAGPITGLSNEVTVTVNVLPTVAVTPNSGIICQPSAANVPLMASGATGYTWLPAAGLSATTGANVTATPSGTTTYTVTGTDANGCTNTATAVINVNGNVIISSATASPASVCSGATSNLNVTAAAVPTDYTVNTMTYGITTPVTPTNITFADPDDGSTAIPLPFGFYFYGSLYNTIYVHTNGFVSFSAAQPTGTPYLETIPTTATPNNYIALCHDDLNVTGGGTVTYFRDSLGPNNRVFIINYNTVKFFNGASNNGNVSGQIKLFESDYHIEVHATASNDPTATAHTLGIENATGTAGVAAPGRNNVTYSFTAAASEAWRFNPTSVLTYAWSPSAGLTPSSTVSNPTTPSLVSPVNNYTVIVSNGGGCPDTATVSISAGTALISTAITTNAPLCNGTDNVMVTAHPAGGGAPYNYSWSLNGGPSYTSPFATDTLTLGPGTYTLQSTVSDLCGATTIQNTSFTVNAIPTATASVVSPACVGNTVSFTGTTDIGTTYSWTGPNVFTSNLLSPGIPSATTAASGVYSFTATANGCTSPVATTTLVVNPTPTGITATATNDTICTGGSIDLNAPFIATPTVLSEDFNAGAPTWTRINNSTGGTPANAAWIDRADGYSYASSPAVTFHSNDNSQFVLTNADPQGSGSITRTFLVSPTFSTVGLTTCNLSFYHSYRDVSATQPNDSGTVQISTDGVTWNNLQMYNSDQPATHGQFAAVNINLNAYVNNPNVQVRFNYYSTWDWWWAVDNVLVNGNATPPAYAWTSTPVGFTSALQNPTGVTPVTNTTYTVTATNSFGCTASATTSVVVNPAPTVGASATDLTICIGESTDLLGTGAASYTWNPGALTGTPVTVSPVATTTYTVTGTSAQGCTNTNTVTITVNPLPNVTANATDAALCPSESTTLTGGGAVSYVWTGSVTDGVPFSPPATATYTVTGTDANACSNTASITVTVNPNPTISYTSSPNDSVCTGSNVTLSGTGGVSYTWTGSITDATPFAAIATTTYTVTGTDGNGCTNTASAVVTVNPLPTIGSTASPSSTVCMGANVTLSGTGATSYTWTGGITDATPFPASATTTYTVTGTDVNGCSNTGTATINVNPLPTIGYTASPNDTVCSGVTVTLNGTGAVSYTWSGGITNGVGFPANTTTTYTVTGTDANTCTNTATATVVVNSIPSVNLGPDVIQPNPPAVLDAGAGFDSYLWSTTATTQTISVNANGTFIVTVTDNGCTDSDTIQVFFTAGVMDENNPLATVKLYPNPSDGSFNVSVDNLETENLVMEIMDMTGRTVYNHVAGSVSGNIIVPFSLNELRMGTYILRLQANGKTTQLRFVVNK